MQRVDINNFRNKKCALVLSGGIVKAAAWHLGVAHALEELGFSFKNNTSPAHDLEISTYVGSSAGAFINVFLSNGHRPMDVINAFIDNRKDSSIPPVSYRDMLSIKRQMKKPPRSSIYDPFDGIPRVIRSLVGPLLGWSGIFTTSGLVKYLEKNVAHNLNFEDYIADLFIVATQLDHSRKVIFSKYNMANPTHDPTAHYYTGINVLNAVGASMSVPPFYAPFPVKNPKTNETDYYIDGEIRDTLSTHIAVDNDCEFIISSWTHTPYHYHDEIGSLVNYGLPAVCTQAIYLMIQKKIISNRAERVNAKDIIDTVSSYLKDEKFSEKHRKKLTQIIARKLHYKEKTHFIDIYPKHDDYKLFFLNSFSLKPQKLISLVNSGYHRAKEIFKNHEWES